MPAAALFLLATLASRPAPPPGGDSFRILMTGSYHGTEVKADSGRAWLGLFDTGDRYELRRVELVIERVHDPILDGEGEATGREVSLAGGDEGLVCLLLPSSSHPLTEGVVHCVHQGSPELRPDTLVRLDGTHSVRASDKGLFLTDGTIEQRLCDSYPDSHGESVRIVWAGDLDGDGRVDLILDDRFHYVVWRSFGLYLSGGAEPPHLVEKVTEFVAVSD